ncbi:hypothetical protein AURDEDRAFT_174259 [Auricularia subglabra TFB-10046 SS5]|uniref:Uncharacterized protein n=1 Tax=Auricularia subglabra (strain TFB-10046 / SS5) TaxID=717982 RepID=J0WTD5_AURST|nr:hypothetical protein AURDEDRAFT_174259 [Auricularia subglabra TFB-10046 SS5]
MSQVTAAPRPLSPRVTPRPPAVAARLLALASGGAGKLVDVAADMLSAGSAPPCVIDGLSRRRGLDVCCCRRPARRHASHAAGTGIDIDDAPYDDDADAEGEPETEPDCERTLTVTSPSLTSVQLQGILFSARQGRA